MQYTAYTMPLARFSCIVWCMTIEAQSIVGQVEITNNTTNRFNAMGVRTREQPTQVLSGGINILYL